MYVSLSKSRNKPERITGRREVRKNSTDVNSQITIYIIDIKGHIDIKLPEAIQILMFSTVLGIRSATLQLSSGGNR